MKPMKLHIPGQPRSRMLRRYCAIPLAALLIAVALSACKPDPPSCPGNLDLYKGRCLTHTAVAYVGCTEGRGLSTSQEISTGATLPEAAGVTLNVAYKQARTENSVVALQIVKDCLKLAEAGTSGTEKTSVRRYGQRTTQTIDNFKQQLPGIELDPEKLTCGPADVDVSVPCGDGVVTITNTGFKTLEINSVEKKEGDIGDFDIHNCVGAKIAPGANCKMTVEFKPHGSGPRMASFVIHQNIPKPDPGTTLQLVGTGIAGGGPSQEYTL